MSSRGRLTLVKQRDMEKTLRDCFLKGYSESGTVAITEIGINTVSKYFKRWHAEILENDKREFSYGCRRSIRETGSMAF